MSRIPHGMRGLKYKLYIFYRYSTNESHPAWDAWIEMIVLLINREVKQWSHPAWDAWIEILAALLVPAFKTGVASRMGCVD